MSVLKTEHLPHYTWSDYQSWDGAWELIGGVPFAMSPAPSIEHQTISSKIHGQLFDSLKKCEKCQALLPVDWKINEETVVQPDNLVICEKVSGQYLNITPVIIFEILSPSTAKKDTGLKFELYQQEGVNYYIVVNPDEQIAKVYQLSQEGRFVKKKDMQNETFSFTLESCDIGFDFSQIWAS